MPALAEIGEGLARNVRLFLRYRFDDDACSPKERVQPGATAALGS